MKNKFFAIVLMNLAFIGSLYSSEWAQFQLNPGHNAVIEENEIEFPLCTTWKRGVSYGMVKATSPLVDEGGIIYLNENNGMEAINSADGKTIWANSNTNIRNDAYPQQQYLAVVKHGGKIVGYNSKKLIAIDALTGNKAYEVLAALPGGEILVSRPALYEGKVYIGTSEGGVAEFDAGSGVMLRLMKAAGGGIYSTPTFDSAGSMYFGSTDQSFYCVDLTTGAVKWKTEIWGGPIYGTPVYAEGTVCFGTSLGFVAGLDSATGTLLWKKTAGAEVNGTGAVKKGIFYVGSNDCHVYAFDCRTGKLYWKVKCGNNFVVMSVLIVKNKLVILGCRGAVVILDIDKVQPKQICYSNEANHTAVTYWKGKLIFFDVSHKLYLMEKCGQLCGVCSCDERSPDMIVYLPDEKITPVVYSTPDHTPVFTPTQTATVTAAATQIPTALNTHTPTPAPTMQACGKTGILEGSLIMIMNPESIQFDIFEFETTAALAEGAVLTVYPNGGSSSDEKVPLQITASLIPGETKKYRALYPKRTGYGDVRSVKAEFEDICGNRITAEVKPDRKVLSGKDVVLFNNKINSDKGETCRISYRVHGAGMVEVTIYGRNGNLIKTIFAGYAPETDRGEVSWDGTSEDGSKAASGIYVVLIKTDYYQTVEKIAVIR